MLLNNSQELESFVSEFLIRNADHTVTIIDEKKLVESGIDRLVFTSALSTDTALAHDARVVIRHIATALGIHAASIFDLYKAMGEGLVKGFCVPALNIRMMNYDLSQAIFAEAQKVEAGAFIFEIARSEMKYCDQSPGEFSASILGAAIKTGFRGPVFIQGDHFQFNKEKFSTHPQGEIDEIELLIKDALMAQFYNVDIDASTLVDLTKEDLADQQRDNYEMTAELTKYIRGIQPPGVVVNIGGEIGHIGGVNSSVDDFNAFMEGYTGLIGSLTGISKVSVATGTSHGGTVESDGSMKTVDLDFDVLKAIREVANDKYKIAGPVQHGASTLPTEMFATFVESGAVEVHLSTEIMNIMMENLPRELIEKMEEWTLVNCKDEAEEGWNETQIIYKLRKKSVGQFKKECWELSEDDRAKIRDAVGEKIRQLFESFNIAGTSHTVRQYIA